MVLETSTTTVFEKGVNKQSLRYLEAVSYTLISFSIPLGCGQRVPDVGISWIYILV